MAFGDQILVGLACGGLFSYATKSQFSIVHSKEERIMLTLQELGS
jgi:hypothetical protein